MMVTVVPPTLGPEAGDTVVTVGAATYVYMFAVAGALAPPGVLTLML
jgi:hypothetical protein